ncbi:DUF362 domain-containing protein [Occallatibacter riparius]|uniref:DUF362 domain-containing protein n=1 Tax=Occallatibacter riparius TaxID=1002689 RepID=A0A9J7BFZ8_9BACT|nr:DUF362 domain-containing protein [Occallatibacter riparius]UWZ81932.1 DUF362 domain-containing protein [Occallatibacter riparius]
MGLLSTPVQIENGSVGDMKAHLNRRELIQRLGAAAAGLYLAPARLTASTPAPIAPVAISRCSSYGPEVVSALASMFDQLGGLAKLVSGKTVAIKINVTGSSTERFRGLSQGQTYWVHPQVVSATVHLLGQAGARRIRLLESPTSSKVHTLEEFISQAGWKVSELTSAAPRVEMENTNFAGPSKQYVRFAVPGGGMLFKAYDLNRSYEDCDVFVSLAKLKEHTTAGLTGSMKNLFGITPTTIYGEGAGIDEPSQEAAGGRSMLHNGSRQPSKSALPELNPHSPRDPGYRVPRVTVDLVAARPIHLSIIDGIQTVAGGEGPWARQMRTVPPGLLIAGTNCVTTDAVCAALMGFDPMADRGTPPFENCDSTLKLAEELGIGTRDLRRVEVIGVPISKGRIDFRKV